MAKDIRLHYGRITLASIFGRGIIHELKRQVEAAEAERDNVTNDRLKLLELEKKANLLRREYMKKQEGQFFDAMRLDLELERQIKEFTEKEKMSARVMREFVLKVEDIKNER